MCIILPLPVTPLRLAGNLIEAPTLDVECWHDLVDDLSDSERRAVNEALAYTGDE